MYPFGKSFERWYYPLINDTTPEGSILTAQTPAIYIFRTNPGRSVAAVGTGALQTITSWTWDANQAGWRYTIAAISDPSPTSSETVYAYWEAVNFRLESGADIQTDLRVLDLQRVSGHSTAVNVTDEMLRDYFPQLDSCSTEAQRVQQLVLAIEDVKARLKSKGYEWAKVIRPDRLTIAIAYRVLYMIMLVQIQQGNDKYAIKYAEFKAIFEGTIDSLSLEYDSNGDGQADTTVTAATGVVFLSR